MKIAWELKGKPIYNINQLPANAFGFVYKITFNDGKQYIGRKNLYQTRKRNFSKKELSHVSDKRKKTYEMVTRESDWNSYNGSNKLVINKLKEDLSIIKKEIIKVCFSNKQLTYFETQMLFSYSVLEYPDDFYNDNILGKFFRKDIVD